VEDPESDHVDIKVSVEEGNAVIDGNVIRFTLPTPLSMDSDGLLEVSATVSDSGSCQEKTFKTVVSVGVAGDQLGSGCSLIR
jgi:hypothetical protein